MFIEDEGASLNSFKLVEPQERWDFLWRLSEIGEEGLLAATSHVWGSLAAPRAARCSLMAGKLGTGGKGQAALFGVLKQFLNDFEKECDPPPLPLREAYKTSVEWHAAVNTHFAAGDAAMYAVIERYSAILNADTTGANAESKKGIVLTGPWKVASAT